MAFFYPSWVTGAPTLTATAGSMRTLLKTCLQDGWGAAPVASLSVAAGTATVKWSTAHPYVAGMTCQLSGASVAALNGPRKVLSVVDAFTVTLAAAGIPDGAVSGTITSRIPGAGWSEVFYDNNVAGYKSADPLSTGCFLRVDDTGTNSARVVGYETMTGASAGTGAFPTSAQQSGGLFWPKAHNATGSRTWALVADGRAFYLVVQPTTGATEGSIVGFGDLLTGRTEPWACFIGGHAAQTFGGGAGCLSAVGSSPSATLALPKPGAGVGTGVLAYLMSMFRTSGVSGSATGSQLPTWPNPAGGETVLNTPQVVASDGLRGRLPGLKHTPAAIQWATQFDTTQWPGYLVARTLVGTAGAALIDLGDWRG